MAISDPWKKPKRDSDVVAVAEPTPVARRTTAKPRPPRNQTAAASVIRFKDSGWKQWKFGSSIWQLEAWRHYDRCGELHAVSNAVANMISRVELAIHKKVDGQAGPRADKPAIAALSETIYGGPEQRPELLRLAGLNLFVAGEFFNYIESPADDTVDRWMVLSVTQIKRAAGSSTLTFARPHDYGGGVVEYDPDSKSKDAMLIRAWTQHGQLSDHPDSSVRAAIVVLNLIEQYDKRSSAQNDSRLAGAGVMFLPDSFDFPSAPDQTPADAFEARVGTEMGKTLSDPGNARSLVPVMATVGGEDIDKIKWLTFETPLDEQTKDRLDQCIRRLALDLDVPPELLLGVGDMNHWSAWQSEESTIKTFVAPLAARICHALTIGWMRTMLEAIGEDPDEYMVWFDTSPLTVRPDRQADAVALWQLGLLSDEAVRKAGNWDESDAHDEESYKRWIITQSILKNPALISDPNFGGAVGITATPAAAEQPAIGYGNAPPEQPDSARSPAQEALVTGAEMAALHSLAVAGKKLLRRDVRDELLHEFSGRTHELYTRLPADGWAHAVNLLDGTWDLLAPLSARTGTHRQILQDSIGFYCSGKMVSGSRHDSSELLFLLSQGILAAGHQRCSPTECVNRHHPNTCSGGQLAVAS